MNEDTKLKYYAAEAKEIKQMCDRKLKDIVPVMSEAIEGLLKITKAQLEEMKSLHQPIPVLKTIMQAVCILLKIQPTEVYTKENNYKKSYDYWKSAVGPNLLGNPHII